MRGQYARGRGNNLKSIMILTDFPTIQEQKSGIAFESYSTFTKIVDDSLEFEGENIMFDDLYSSYCIKETITGKKRSDLDFKEYKKMFYANGWDESLRSEIDRVNPTVILAMGTFSSELLTGVKFKDAQHSIENLTIYEDLKNIRVVSTYTPYYIDNQINSFSNYKPAEKFSNAIDKCFFISTGNEDALKINYTQHRLVNGKEDFDKLMDYVEQTGLCCFDYETTGLDWYDSKIFCTVLSISFQVGSSWVIPLYHKEPIFEIDNKTGEKIVKAGKYIVEKYEPKIFDNDFIDYMFSEMESRIFNNPLIIKIAHNLKFDMHWNMRNGITKFSGRFCDTMLMGHILDELTPNGLKDYTRAFFPKYANYEKALKKYSWDYTPLEILGNYAGIDTDITLRLWIMFEEDLILDDDLHTLYLLYRNLTMPAFFTLLEAEHHGAKIDRKLIEKSIDEGEEILARKLNDLKGFKEYSRFIIREEIKTNKVAIQEYLEKIEKRKSMLEKKKISRQDDLLQKRINLENEILTLDEDKDSKDITKIRKKIDTVEKNISKLLEAKDDKFIENYRTSIRELKTGKITSYGGFNFNSPKQLGELLYTPSGFGFLPMDEFIDGEIVQKKTTNADYLNQLEHPFIDKLFAYRSISKMISTYYKGILERLDKNDFIHTSFLLHGTVSGRLSSRNPNFQNIPSRSKLDDDDAVHCLKLVKKFFCSIGEDYTLAQFDYSQAELRLIANFSKDENMIDTYQRNIDIHTMTASKLSGRDFEEFMQLDDKERKKHRNNAKGANFGLVYDISIEGYIDYCKKTFGLILSEEEGKIHYNIFFNAYPRLKEWHKEYKDYGKIHGYVRTLFGRKRHLPNINDGWGSKQSADERYAINSPIQGSGGEYTMFTFAILKYRLPKSVIFFNTVHDSIFFYIPKNIFEYARDIIVDACENPPIYDYFNIKPLAVTMKVDLEVSDKSWGDMEEQALDFQYKN